MYKYKINNNKGITLVALVVTIIIIILLAGTALNLTIGEDGILTRAKKSTEQNEFATVRDTIILSINEIFLENYDVEKLDTNTSISMVLFEKGYIDYKYKVNMQTYKLDYLTLGHGSTETGDYYSLKDEELSYIDKNNNKISLYSIEGIGKIPIELHFEANIDKNEIKLDSTMESTVLFEINNFKDDEITYEDISYEISMKDNENSAVDVIIGEKNLSNENYTNQLKGNEKQTQKEDVTIRVKNGKSLSSETIELELNILKPIKLQKTYKIQITNDILVDYSGNNYHATLKGGTKIIRDNENNCALYFDGLDDFVQIPTISQNFNWSDGFNINLIASVESDNDSGILTLGNGKDNDHIIIENINSGNKLKFEAQGKRELTIKHTNYSYDNTVYINQKTNYKININTNFLQEYHSQIYVNDTQKSGNGGGMFKTITPIRNVERKENYIGKSYWDNKENFKGKIYYLKITDGSGKTILEYDLNHNS